MIVTDYSTLTDAEIAEQVARRVMGWRYVYGIDTWAEQVGDEAGNMRIGAAGNRWSPAESWSDAGRVLERMREEGWSPALLGAPQEPYSVRFSDDRRTAEASAITAPRAICEAALLALDAREGA